MNLEQKNKLIDIVKSTPELWKLTKKNPHLKQKLWNDVATQLGTTSFDARRQWEILRDQFRRDYKRYAIDSNYKSKWVLYDRMVFVGEAIRPRDGLAYQSNSETEGQGSEEQMYPDMDASQLVEEKYSILSTEMGDLPKIQVRQDLQGIADSSYSQSTAHNIPDGEPSTSAGVSSSSQRPRGSQGVYSSTSRKKRRCHTDRDSSDEEDYHFVMSILPSLRCIQHTKKLRVRSKIMELIATELDEIEPERQLQMTMYPEVGVEAENSFLPVVLPKEMQ